MNARLLAFILLSIGLVPARAEDAARVEAVLSSDSPYYREALSGFQEAVGRSVPVCDLGKEHCRLPKGIEVVAAFGSKAGLQPYPEGVRVVYWAPGLNLVTKDLAAIPIKVSMEPNPAALLSEMTGLQPGLKRLAVLWISQAVAAYLPDFKREAEARGIEVQSIRLDAASQIPDGLRSLKKPDALWLPPDPALITPRSFDLIKNYSLANKVPFYAPTEALVEEGALAFIGASFKEIGRTAGTAAVQLLAGKTVPPGIYPEHLETVVNSGAAAQCGLALPREALKKASKVLP